MESVRGQSLVDLGNRRLNLLLPHGVLRRAGLALKFRPCEAQRFDLACAFGIYGRRRGRAAFPLGFPFVDLLLDARVGVDQAFSRITHNLWLPANMALEADILKLQFCLIPPHAAIIFLGAPNDGPRSESLCAQVLLKILPSVHAQLRVHVVQVDLDGSDTDPESIGHLLVVEPQGNEPQDLDFANGQDVLELRLGGPTLRQPLRQPVVLHDELLTAVVDRPDALLQDAWGHRFQHDTSSAQSRGVQQFPFVLACGEDDDGRWHGRIETTKDAQPRLIGKREVEKEHVRLMGLDRAQAFSGRAAHRHDLEIGVGAQKLRKAIEDQRMIVDQDQSNRHVILP